MQILVPIAPKFETRTLLFAQGLDFTNAEFRMNDEPDLLIPDATADRMQRSGLQMEITSGTTASFFSAKQGVLYNIRLIFTKKEFKEALETPDVHVIYSGHSRIGRGSCFGLDIFKQPGEDWEDGEEPELSGLFRMGYPFVPVPVSDIQHHGYKAAVVPSSQALSKEDCHPMLQAAFSQKKEFSTTELEAQLTDKDPRHRPRWHVDDPDLLFKKFWGVDMVSVAGIRERHAVLFGGWEGTTTDPFDLGGTDIKCKVLCIFACSTQMHFGKIIRERKQWQHQGDEGYAFFTNEASSMIIAPQWLYHMLTYPKFNAGQPLNDLLDYVKNRTNTDLVTLKVPFRVTT